MEKTVSDFRTIIMFGHDPEIIGAKSAIEYTIATQLHGDLLLAAIPHHLGLVAAVKELTDPNQINKQLHGDYIKVSVY